VVAVDNKGDVHLAYVRVDLDSQFRNQLVYSNNRSGVWVFEVVADELLSSASIGMSIDSADNPIITYSPINSRAHYAVRQGETWIIGELGVRTKFRVPAALDSQGRLRASYYDESLGDLEVETVFPLEVAP